MLVDRKKLDYFFLLFIFKFFFFLFLISPGMFPLDDEINLDQVKDNRIKTPLS